MGTAGKRFFFLLRKESVNVKRKKEDMQITKRIEKAGEILGIPVIDHVVIGEGEFYSLKEREKRLV